MVWRRSFFRVWREDAKGEIKPTNGERSLITVIFHEPLKHVRKVVVIENGVETVVQAANLELVGVNLQGLVVEHVIEVGFAVLS